VESHNWGPRSELSPSQGENVPELRNGFGAVVGLACSSVALGRLRRLIPLTGGCTTLRGLRERRPREHGLFSPGWKNNHSHGP